MLKVPISGVASFLGVSRPQVYKAIREYGIEYKKFTDLSDSRLEEIMASVKENHPSAGEVMLQGHLRAQGLHVQRNRLRTAIHQSDPIGTEARRRPPIRRRVYSVPCPNYLWHIDGNHKLIRWRMVRRLQSPNCILSLFNKQQGCNGTISIPRSSTAIRTSIQSQK